MQPESIAIIGPIIERTVHLIRELQSSARDSETTHKITAIQSCLSDLQSEISRSQAHTHSLEITISELRQQTRDLQEAALQHQQWLNDLAHYQLQRVAPGCFLYLYKPAPQSTTPIHALCPDCVADHKKSFIQYVRHPSKGHLYVCNRCGLQVHIPMESLSPF